MRHSAGAVSFCNALFGKRCQLLQSAVSFCKALSAETGCDVLLGGFCQILQCTIIWDWLQCAMEDGSFGLVLESAILLVLLAFTKRHAIGVVSFCKALFRGSRQLLQCAILWVLTASS